MLLSLFVFNKRQTGETDKTQFFHGNSQEYITQGMESSLLVSIEKLCWKSPSMKNPLKFVK